MTLDQVKNEIEAYSHKVITKSHVLTLLASIERDECPNCVRIPVFEMSSIRDASQPRRKVGD